jgi:hypothetical protein
MVVYTENKERDNTTIVFDDESLIRVFVRARAECTPKMSFCGALYTSVLQRTGYRLPLKQHLQDDEKRNNLKRVCADLKAAHEYTSAAEKEQYRVMNITHRVVAPTTIVYYDAASLHCIPYEEYERRYTQYIQYQINSRMKLHLL